MSHIENSSFVRNFVNRGTEKAKAVAASSTAVVVLPLSLGMVAKAGPDTISPENRSPLVASSERHSEQRSSHASLQQEAWKFLTDPTDAQDARTKSDALGEVGTSQDGTVATERKANDVYEITWFGTSSDKQLEEGFSDGGQDNSALKYEDIVRDKLSKRSETWKNKLQGKSGQELEKAVQYFTAGAGEQFPPGHEVKITAPNGKVVIAVVGDEGPAMWAQERDNKAKFDTSWDTWNALGRPVKVKVEPVREELEPVIDLGPKNEKPKSNYGGKVIVRRK